jgi:hypothetical protein
MAPEPNPMAARKRNGRMERRAFWRVLAAAVTDERIVYPAACGWIAGIVAAAAWDESWPRILATGAAVALSCGVIAAVRSWRGTQGRSGASQCDTGESTRDR